MTNAIAIPNLTSGGNSTMKLACDEDAVAIAAGDTTVKITPGTVQAEVGGTVLTVSPDGVTIEGKLTVNGSISLANHTHKGDSGGMTGKPQ